MNPASEVQIRDSVDHLFRHHAGQMVSVLCRIFGFDRIDWPRLNAAAIGALTDASVRTRLADLAQEIFPGGQQTPEALGAYHKAEIAKWWPILKAANIKAE